MPRLDATLYTDPGCPWAYSANPDLAALHWRYGDALRWRLVMIGLAEDNARYTKLGYTPVRMVQGWVDFRRRFGMPFGATPRARVPATGRACRAVVATRLLAPELEWAAVRALQFGWFCSDLLLDEDEAIARALATVEGLDPAEIVAALDDPETEEAYQRDRAEARTAEGSPTEAQGKAAASDGPVRYTAPSAVFLAPDGRRLEAGGFQSLEAYDVCLANLDPGLPRTPPPEDPYDALAAFPHGLTTQEVAAILCPALTERERSPTEVRLLELVGQGRARRTPMGDDALWHAT